MHLVTINEYYQLSNNFFGINFHLLYFRKHANNKNKGIQTDREKI